LKTLLHSAVVWQHFLFSSVQPDEGY